MFRFALFPCLRKNGEENSGGEKTSNGKDLAGKRPSGEKTYPNIVKGCRSTPTADVTVYIPPIRVETGEASGEETDESTDGPARGAEDVGAQATSQSTSMGRDRRNTINTEHELTNFMKDHLKASIGSLSIDWYVSLNNN